LSENRGKKFETQVRGDFEKVPDTSVYRLQDSMGGYAGVANICDFIVYHYPVQFFIECKCHYGNTLPFSCITERQWDGLLEMSKIKGVCAGILVWFIDHDKTIFIPIDRLQTYKEQGLKSVNIRTMSDLDWVEIKGKKKRVMFDYDMNDFVNKISHIAEIQYS